MTTGAVFANDGKGRFTREDGAYVTAQPSQLWSTNWDRLGRPVEAWDDNMNRPGVMHEWRKNSAQGGAVLGDVNGDGRTDILFKNRLFLNDGAMRFTMDTRMSDLNQADFRRRASLADVDNDGGALRVPTVIHERTASM